MITQPIEVKKHFNAVFPQKKVTPYSLNSILNETCRILRTSQRKLKSKSREEPLPDFRTIFAVNALRFGFSTIKVGYELNRDHSTIISMKRRYRDYYETDTLFRSRADKVKEGIDDLVIGKSKGLNNWYNDSNQQSL